MMLLAALASHTHLVVPDADRIVLSASVSAPDDMTEQERGAWNVLGQALAQGTEQFPPGRFVAYASQTGRPPRIIALEDHVQVQIVVPKDALSMGYLLMSEVLTRPEFREEDLQKIIDEGAMDQTPWESALERRMWDSGVTTNEVRHLHRKSFAQERIHLSVAGAFDPQSAFEQEAGRFDLEKSRLPRVRFRDIKPVPAPAQPTEAHELRGKPISLGAAGTAPLLLAAHALGSGKSSSVFRILREQNRWSYRQEALLWPGKGGWRLRVVMIEANADVTAEQMREPLLADVETWTEDHRGRALAMAEATLSGKNPNGVLHLAPFTLYNGSLEHQAQLRALLSMSGSPERGMDDLLDQMRQVSLEDLKAAASAFLAAASAHDSSSKSG